MVIGVGEADAIGDVVGTGCAVAASDVAPAMNAPAKTSPKNHRFMMFFLSAVPKMTSLRLVPMGT